MKAPKVMIEAVKKVAIKDRRAAAEMAEKSYSRYLTLALADEAYAFGESVAKSMAAESAAADVLFYFA